MTRSYSSTTATTLRGRSSDSSILLPSVQEVLNTAMSKSDSAPHSRSDSVVAENAAVDIASAPATSSNGDFAFHKPPTPTFLSPPGSPALLSRNPSFSSQTFQEDWEIPPLDRLSFFDLFDSLALPARLDKLQLAWTAQMEKVKQQQTLLRSTGANAKDRAVREFRKRVPTADEQLEKYRKRMKQSVDHINKRWNDTASISAREKVSFISAVLNVFISGYLIGACPQYYYYWFTAQFCYFMPIRYVTYHRRGHHYFLADLCYFVNILTLLCIWVFPNSKRLLISAYCLAYGNNAVAIAMWRNSLVFHSLDKVTSLFIHVMPPVTLHCIVHLTPKTMQMDRFPAVFQIKYSSSGSPQHYTLLGMLIWATVPYAVWQVSYHFFISVRRAEQIAAGRPTSFTWLRKSYSKTWIGKFVLRQPEYLQEPTFMMIQYFYAILTILPCPVWFYYRWPSAGFLLFVFTWSIWNGANFYMDIFGKRFQKELEQMKKDVAKWQNSPDGFMISPVLVGQNLDNHAKHGPSNSIDSIPPLDEKSASLPRGATATGAETTVNGNVAERSR